MENSGNTKKLFIGNLNFKVTDEEQFKTDMGGIGNVISATIVKDRETGRPRGFGFLVVDAADEQKFLDANGSDYEGRDLVVKPAIERPRGEGRGGDRGGYQGNQGGRGGYQGNHGGGGYNRDDRRPPRRDLNNQDERPPHRSTYENESVQ